MYSDTDLILEHKHTFNLTQYNKASHGVFNRNILAIYRVVPRPHVLL